jgi:hypothetical protein
MPNYKINSTGNIIIADQSFVDHYYPNDYTLVPETPAPVVRAPISKREFLKLFTPAEYAAIKTAAEGNAVLDFYWQQFLLAEFISMDDPDTIGGINMLSGIGLLTPARAIEILGA